MTNAATLRSLCTAMASTFYPDRDVLDMALTAEGINPDAVAYPKDAELFRIAVALVMGYVEGSRSEGGVATSVRAEAVERSIRHWCSIYGLDPEDVLADRLRTIQDGSTLW